MLGLYGYKTGLLVAQVVALVIMSAVFLILISGIQINRHELTMKDVAAKHIAAPKYLLPTAFLDTVTQQLPILLITTWYSSEAAGSVQYGVEDIGTADDIDWWGSRTGIFSAFSWMFGLINTPQKECYLIHGKFCHSWGSLPWWQMIFLEKNYLPGY